MSGERFGNKRKCRMLEKHYIHFRCAASRDDATVCHAVGHQRWQVYRIFLKHCVQYRR
uniref:Uncharacterized protein n=1 Tax=Parascaris equorum TaxID=6256 RepID=A0A914R998_PAREQ